MLRNAGIALAVLAVAGGAAWWVLSAEDRALATFDQGMKLMGPKTYPEAIRKFDSAIATWDRNPHVYLQRGIAKAILKQSDAALEDFSRAVAIDPNLAEAYTGRGDIYRERGEIQQAIEEFTRSINLHPTVDGHFQRGELYEKLGEHQKAVDDFDRAIAIDRLAPYVYRARSLARKNLGDEAGYVQDRDFASSIERK